MLCEKCKKNKATVLYKQVINGVASSARLCASCAPATSFGFGADINLFGGLFENAVRTAAPEVKCDLCGATYAQIAREGKVGCAKCYENFADRLRGSIERIHGAVRHVPSDDEGPLRHGGAVTPSSTGEAKDAPSVRADAQTPPPTGEAVETAGARGVPRSERSELWGFRASPRPTEDNPSVTQGVTPPLAQGRQTAGEVQSDALRRALAAAIAEERYEDAARIRDEIKEAEESHGH